MKYIIICFLLMIAQFSSAMDDRMKIAARVSELHPSLLRKNAFRLSRTRSLPHDINNLKNNSCIINIPEQQHSISLKTQPDKDDDVSIETLGKISQLAEANSKSKEKCCTPAVAVVSVAAITAISGTIAGILTAIVTLTIHFTAK